MVRRRVRPGPDRPPAVLHGDTEDLRRVGVRHVRRSVRPDHQVVQERVRYAGPQRREQPPVTCVDPHIRCARVIDAVRTAGDVHAPLRVDRDSARGPAAVRAVSAQPLGRGRRSQLTAVDLTAGGLGHVVALRASVVPDAFELRPVRVAGQLVGGGTRGRGGYADADQRGGQREGGGQGADGHANLSSLGKPDCLQPPSAEGARTTDVRPPSDSRTDDSDGGRPGLPSAGT